MKKRRPAVTLKDIAAKTGYSVNTVSRALRDKDDIAAPTREMIQKTAQEMGHVSNTLAASLRLGYTNTIAVILGDISNPHFSIMMKEIEAMRGKPDTPPFCLTPMKMRSWSWRQFSPPSTKMWTVLSSVRRRRHRTT